MLYDGSTFTHMGHAFRVNMPADDTCEAPWDRDDCHGPVSDWLPIEHKGPGDMILCRDRGSARFYDFAAAVKLARREWVAPGKVDGATCGERAAKAALEDYDRLRRWCADQWAYCGVVVTLLDGEDGDDAEDTAHSDSVWGIEDDCRDYIEDTARELAGCILGTLLVFNSISAEVDPVL